MLINWAARSTAGYAVDHWDELGGLTPSARLKELENSRYKTTKAAMARGTEVHDLAHRLGQGEEVDVPEHLGGFIDSYGVLWSARGGAGLLRYDTNTRTGRCMGNGQGDYGLGLDPKTGDIWHTYLGSGALGEVVPHEAVDEPHAIGRVAHGVGEVAEDDVGDSG